MYQSSLEALDDVRLDDRDGTIDFEVNKEKALNEHLEVGFI